MFSVERPVIPKFNVDAKPFEMYLPRREPLSSESSDSSDYGAPPAPLFMAATSYAAAGADDSANTNSDGGDGLFLDNSDPLSDADTSPGNELNDESFEPPDDELCVRIVKQVEFYFSDVNLTKDAFLLKHVKRNKEGYVSLKLISSFKKVKTLTKDWRVVAYSLKTSDKLVVNELGTKVRRRDPLPPYDETTPTRTVIAMNLPMERPTVESVTELFAKCGEIALIRILRPGAPIPPDIKQFVNKHPGIGTCVCAVIEFVAVESSQRAVSEMGGKNNDWRSMHVVEMAKGKKPTKGNNNKKDSSPRSEGEEQQQPNKTTTNNNTNNEGENKKKKRNKKRSPKNENKNDDDTSPESMVNSPRNNPQRKANSICEEMLFSSTPTSSLDPLAQLNGRLVFKPETRPRQKAASYSEGGGATNNNTSANNGGANSNGNSPWVHRRRLAAKESGQSPLTSRRVEVSNPGQNATKLLVPEGVLRMPRGPDGTNGFRVARVARDDSCIPVMG